MISMGKWAHPYAAAELDAPVPIAGARASAALRFRRAMSRSVKACRNDTDHFLAKKLVAL